MTARDLPGRPAGPRTSLTSPAGTPNGQPAAPGRFLLTLARDLTQHLADHADAARPAGRDPRPGPGGPELGAWLREQREARHWSRPEMARQLIRAAHAAGDTTMPGADNLQHNIYRWERGSNGLGDRYRLRYCQALGITPRDFGPGPHPAPALADIPAFLAAALSRWLQPPAPQDPAPGPGPGPDLDAVRAAWGDLYDITASGARFRARRRDGTGPRLATDTPAQLNTAIRADWAATAS
jgi:transcriptional regulator with XRE-family HTH domain